MTIVMVGSLRKIMIDSNEAKCRKCQRTIFYTPDCYNEIHRERPDEDIEFSCMDCAKLSGVECPDVCKCTADLLGTNKKSLKQLAKVLMQVDSDSDGLGVAG